MIQQALQQRAAIEGQSGASSPLATINAIASPIAEQQQLASAQQFEMDKIRQKSLIDMAEKKATEEPTELVTKDGILEFLDAMDSREGNENLFDDLIGKRMTEKEARAEATRRLSMKAEKEKQANEIDLKKQRQAELKEERDRKFEERRGEEKERIINKFNQSNGVVRINQSIDAAKTIRELANSGNPIAASAIPTYMARASGEVGNLSEPDKAPFGGSRAILRRMEAAFEEASSGGMSDANRQFINELSDLMEQTANANKNERARELSSQYGKSSDYLDKKQIYEFLRPEGTGLRPGHTIKQMKSKKDGKIREIEFDRAGKPVRIIEE
jgi:hypothetical protein